jgi:hypothetical protein
MLLVPKNDTNLRTRYDCSLLCFELPTEHRVGTGFLAQRQQAVADLVDGDVPGYRLPSPPTSFIGVLSRCECQHAVL